MKGKKAAGGGAAILGAAAVLLYILNKKEDKPAGSGTGTKLTGKDLLQFMANLKPYAMALGKKIGVPYQFIIAQITIETGAGKSSLFTRYFNVGGIKAKKDQKFILFPTWEYVKDPAKYLLRDKTKDQYNSKTGLTKIRTPEKFAVYDNLPAGLVAYGQILQNKYFKKYTFKTEDPKIYASMLQSGKPKYATDINYLPKIYKLVDTIKAI